MPSRADAHDAQDDAQPGSAKQSGDGGQGERSVGASARGNLTTSREAAAKKKLTASTRMAAPTPAAAMATTDMAAPLPVAFMTQEKPVLEEPRGRALPGAHRLQGPLPAVA